MVRQGWLKGAGLFLALAMVAAACGGDDDDDEAGGGGGEAASDFTACEVTDTGGPDDNSFNETAFNGLASAGEELGFEPFVQESDAESDYGPNIQAMIDRPCTLIVTVGFLLGDATATAAEENPDQQFAIVDYDYSTDGGDSADEFENVRELTFSTDEAAFLAGYLAAATTETGTVGTYGGINIPTVTIFMNGFAAGVDYYNEENDENVELVGWDADEQDGSFTGDFDDQAKGRDTTVALIDEGADIIMPVAGPVGEGSIEAIRAGGGDQKLIWVDTDGCESLPDDCDLFLTSVMKNMDVAVEDTVTAAAEGDFQGGAYVGTLENDGVGIAPFNEFEEQVPQELQDTLDDLRQQIIDGDIDTNPADD
jgi:basic membrane protein A and related proteins